MNEEEQPVKRKRGRPKGSRNKTPPRFTVDAAGEVIALPETATVRAVQNSISPPETASTVVPSMILACQAIRREVNLDDPQTLWAALDKYMNLCVQTGMKISNGTLYFACGVSKETIKDWYLGYRRQSNPEYREFAKMAREIGAVAREQYGLEGQVNPILTIFHQKAYDHMTDLPQEEDRRDPLGEVQDPKKIAEKYKDLITD